MVSKRFGAEQIIPSFEEPSSRSLKGSRWRIHCGSGWLRTASTDPSPPEES